MRIRVPEKKGQTAYWQQVVEGLKDLSGIKSLQANPSTAGLLILHAMPENEILEHARELRLFKTTRSHRKAVPIQYKVTRSFKDMNRSVLRFTGGELDLGSVTFLGLVGFGAYQITRGNFTAPAWYTVFWYALNVFLKNQPPDVHEVTDAESELE
jgi:hypothetical protein